MIMDEVGDSEIAVAYDSWDLRALYLACRKCRRNLVFVALIPMLFWIGELVDGARGLDLIYLAIPYLLGSVAVLLILYFLLPALQIRARRKNGWDAPMVVQLNERGVATRHPSQDSQFHWVAIRDVVVRKKWLFLFTSAACAIILPRRCFKDDDQFSDWAKRADLYWRQAKSPG